MVRFTPHTAPAHGVSHQIAGPKTAPRRPGTNDCTTFKRCCKSRRRARRNLDCCRIGSYYEPFYRLRDATRLRLHFCRILPRSLYLWVITSASRKQNLPHHSCLRCPCTSPPGDTRTAAVSSSPLPPVRIHPPSTRSPFQVPRPSPPSSPEPDKCCAADRSLRTSPSARPVLYPAPALETCMPWCPPSRPDSLALLP